MKKLSFNLLFLFLGFSVVLFTTSCDPDGTGTTTGATVSLLEGTDFVSVDTTVEAGSSFTVQLNALPGESDLASLAIYEDNTKIETSRFSVSASGEAITSNNPMLIVGEDASKGITWDITIVAHTEGTSTYDFEVSDVNGTKESATIDITIPENVTPLTLTYNGPATITGPAGLHNLNIVATKGGADLSTIEVTRNGVLADIADLTLLGEEFTANPMDISATYPAGFDGSVRVRSSDGSNAFVITVTDAAGNSESVSVDIIGGNTVTTLEGILFNSSGPVGTGGLDIDAGVGTGSSDATAELKDSGNESPTSDVWSQTIEPVNGAILKSVVASNVGDNFTFEAVGTDAVVRAAYDAGTTISVSQKVQVGDLFAVFANDKYYLLKIKQVNVVAGTNADNYVLDIKY